MACPIPPLFSLRPFSNGGPTPTHRRMRRVKHMIAKTIKLPSRWTWALRCLHPVPQCDYAITSRCGSFPSPLAWPPGSRSRAIYHFRMFPIGYMVFGPLALGFETELDYIKSVRSMISRIIKVSNPTPTQRKDPQAF